MNVLNETPWGTDWAWSLPLILLNVIIHVFGLAFIYDGFTVLLREMDRQRKFMFRFTVGMNAAVLLIVMLHGIEATSWALAYLVLGAIPDPKSAMLYSLGAMTGFGTGNVSLPPHWQMMGVLQSLAGLLLFGLTTAFMFAMFQAVWPSQQQAIEHQSPANSIGQ
ncbi:hypothetical protein [Sinorhizobium sp. NFACC03]|uniref:hypothetical protein n=1 Tax=Sinorhizobium sp. NFACC03 TaxID=1566295 RepID=UPI0008826984|nr:hypothetical protein [Sinorhizobium sp. NFACC03]SDA98566.1 hypothetical protein SAMN03159448_06234 [Sinorhizobium sp. NFACC03]